VYTKLDGKPEGKKPHGRPMPRWILNESKGSKVKGCEFGSSYSGRDQGWALVNMVINLHVQ
jgi:hypothetical protein